MEFSEGTRLRRFVRIITIGHDLLARKTSRFRDQPARRRSRTKYRNHCFAITCLHQRRSPLGRFSRDLSARGSTARMRLSIGSIPVFGDLAKSRTTSSAGSISEEDGEAAGFALSDARSRLSNAL